MARKPPPQISPEDLEAHVQQCIFDAETLIELGREHIHSPARFLSALAVAFTSVAKAHGATEKEVLEVVRSTYNDFSVTPGGYRNVN